MSPHLLVGSYARNGGPGLYSLRRSASTGWTAGDAYGGAQNASFGTYSARHDLYYFVDEQAEGTLGAFRKNDRGWERLARAKTHGAEPCYVALNIDDSFLAVANYRSGDIALFRLDDRTGVPVEPPTMRQNAGRGPVRERQDGSHAHCVCFSRSQRWLYHVDLGTDEVLAYPLDPATGSIGARSTAYRAPPGSGPRHLVFHPVLPLALLLSELASTLTLLQVDSDQLIARQVVSTLPSDFAGESLGGHISVDRVGEHVYVTNRGHDSVATFGWNEAGVLELLQHVPSGGASPRSFVLLEAERQLVLAHEKDGTITSLEIRENGTLSLPRTELAVPGAVFLLVAT